MQSKRKTHWRFIHVVQRTLYFVTWGINHIKQTSGSHCFGLYASSTLLSLQFDSPKISSSNSNSHSFIISPCVCIIHDCHMKPCSDCRLKVTAGKASKELRRSFEENFEEASKRTSKKQNREVKNIGSHCLVRRDSLLLKNMKRTFPRAKQKLIIKKYQSKARLSRNADILVRFPPSTYTASLHHTWVRSLRSALEVWRAIEKCPGHLSCSRLVVPRAALKLPSCVCNYIVISPNIKEHSCSQLEIPAISITQLVH